MNTCTLSGRLVADPEVKTVESGDEPLDIGDFRLAVWRSEDATDFVNVTAFGSGLVRRVESLAKGAMVVVHGRLRHETWTDADDKPRQALRVVAREVYPVDLASYFGAADEPAPGSVDDAPGDVLAAAANVKGGVS